MKKNQLHDFILALPWSPLLH